MRINRDKKVVNKLHEDENLPVAVIQKCTRSGGAVFRRAAPVAATGLMPGVSPSRLADPAFRPGPAEALASGSLPRRLVGSRGSPSSG